MEQPKKPISRFWELYNPTPVSFQVWMSIIAFDLFLLTILYRYKGGEWYVMDTLLATFTVGYVIAFILFGLLLVFILVFALGSLAIVIYRAFQTPKPIDCVKQKQQRLDDLVEKVKCLKTSRDMIDKALKDIEDKDSK